ncbi:MAG: YeeE/YedE family protein, partial [Halobacteria archaeon]|nr:YeeE/YedE family protein [Halobacteria archaeon]
WGAAGLALLSLATLLVAGHPWSITFAFGLWGTKLWAALGGDISSWSYWNHGYAAAALGRSVLADATSIMDIGIILGAILAAGLAGRFAPADPVRLRDILTAIAGGLLLGYGARLAFGCNIGGLLAGLGSGSLHGWLWLASGFMGSIIGVYLRQGFGLDKPVK